MKRDRHGPRDLHSDNDSIVVREVSVLDELLAMTLTYLLVNEPATHERAENAADEGRDADCVCVHIEEK